MSRSSVHQPQLSEGSHPHLLRTEQRVPLSLSLTSCLPLVGQRAKVLKHPRGSEPRILLLDDWEITIQKAGSIQGLPMIRAQTPRFCHLWAFPHGQVDPFPTIESYIAAFEAWAKLSLL